MVVTNETDVVDPVGEVGVDQLGEVADHAGGDRAVAGQVVARHERERAGVGAAPGGEPATSRAGAVRTSAVGSRAQRRDVGLHLGVVAVEAAVGAAQVAGLGDGDRDGARRPARPR